MSGRKKTQKLYIHIFPKEKFTKGYVEFINKYFGEKGHRFYIINIDSIGGTIPRTSNVELLTKDNYRDFIKTLSDAKSIYLHSFFSERTIYKIFGFRPWLLKKTTWIAWGGDIYNYRIYNKTIKGKIKICVKRFFVKKFQKVAVLADNDFEYAKKYYKARCEKHVVSYVTDSGQAILDKLSEKKRVEHEETRIVIGNSATETCLHKRMLDQLKKFKDENIKIYLPLSYGDKVYAKEIEEYAKNIFFDKVVVIKEYMDREKYYIFLRDMDIGIFANERQQAMGNISVLLSLGAKVYLNPIASMYRLYEEQGYRIHNVADIGTSDFFEFTSCAESDRNKNIQVRKENDPIKKSIEMWSELFELDSSIRKR